ncbi:hypothetical protein [Planococcus shixiaomingii]|uniref:hypothetical protein n=1 Tax=Planococcus shixiaomingii TaxID=3058393 RepID=UPI00262DB6B6|nr:hypothetical protein [Planococcus sp. N022]WKA54053.1 hypothetical protein QWY21_15475 [Planococcus sp. N022]
MGGSIVIKVPDLHYVLNQEDVESWEVFWRHGLKQHKQIKRQLYYSEENCTVHHMLLFYGHLKVVKIDFQNNCIVFYRGKAERGEFEKFLMEMLDTVYIRSHPNRMHFLVCPKFLSRK